MVLEETYVYLIAHTTDEKPRGPVKVGYTRHPQKRLAALQTGNPSRLQILAQFTTPTPAHAQEMEAMFHKIAVDKRLAGEWFDLDPGSALATAVKLLVAIISADIKDNDNAFLVLEWAGAVEAIRTLAKVGEQDE